MPKRAAWEAYIDSLRAQPLFRGFTGELLRETVQHLQGEIALFRSGEPVTLAAEPTGQPSCLGLLLAGKAFHVKYDSGGNRSIMDYILPGHLTGCVHVFGGTEYHETTLIAGLPCTFLYLSLPEHEETRCEALSGWPQLTRNIIGILARSNLRLYRKIDILSKRTLREKVLAYLSYERDVHQSDSFTVPLDRQEMSDYLYVDRTSLSSELGKLRKEGVIDFWHSDFCLKSAFPPSAHAF